MYLWKLLFTVCLHTLQDPSSHGTTVNISGGEILDEIITRSRGEIRRTQSPKTSSSTPISTGDIRPANSPLSNGTERGKRPTSNFEGDKVNTKS